MTRAMTDCTEMPTTVRDAMSTDLVTIGPQASIVDAERLLLSYGVDELFIVDGEGWLLGIVPDYQLLKFRLATATNPEPVQSIMSRRCLVIGPESPLVVAARYLRDHVHRRLAVVEDRKLIGQVTRRSVMTWLSSQSRTATNPKRQPEPDDEMRRRLDEMHPPALLRRGATHQGAASRPSVPATE